MKVVTTRAELAQERAALGELGFVPTMGFLHQGHLSLVRRARTENDAVAVSIFVNPTQFGPDEDFNQYPRDWARDQAMLLAEEVDLVWTPRPEDIYPPGFATHVTVEGLTDALEGRYRPGHFTGVSTVVSILLNATRANRAYFGQKDAQQLVIIRRMVEDLAIPTEIIAVPTYREDDGLAMSSRNVYLTEEQRAHATVLHDALEQAVHAWSHGVEDADLIRGRMARIIDADPLASADYVSVADPHTLTELHHIDLARGALCSLAVRFGRTRLIDNVMLPPHDFGIGQDEI